MTLSLLALVVSLNVNPNAPSTSIRPLKIIRAPALIMANAPEDDEGAAIFKPYRAGEEDDVEVPESSKRLFAIVLAVPAIALLWSVATYNPSAEELEQERLRKAIKLRGGGATRGFGKWMNNRSGSFGRWIVVLLWILVLWW